MLGALAGRRLLLLPPPPSSRSLLSPPPYWAPQLALYWAPSGEEPGWALYWASYWALYWAPSDEEPGWAPYWASAGYSAPLSVAAAAAAPYWAATGGGDTDGGDTGALAALYGAATAALSHWIEDSIEAVPDEGGN